MKKLNPYHTFPTISHPSLYQCAICQSKDSREDQLEFEKRKPYDTLAWIKLIEVLSSDPNVIASPYTRARIGDGEERYLGKEHDHIISFLPCLTLQWMISPPARLSAQPCGGARGQWILGGNGVVALFARFIEEDWWHIEGWKEVICIPPPA